MREIEIKARVRDSTAVLQALKDQGIKLGKPLKQHDVVFSQPGAVDNQAGANWLRIRTENDTTTTFTLKQSVTSELDSIEHEVTIDNAAEMISIVALLGYEKYSDLTKIRQKAKHGNLEVCYDSLPGIGTFIEAEKLCPDNADAAIVTKELWDLFTKLGISRKDEETSGYDVLQRKRDKQS